MKKNVKFGEDVAGYNVPVLNEREIRAAAGILFVMMFISVMLAAMKADFLMLKYGIIIFLIDFIIRVFINPKFSPTLILGRLIVRNQTPEYVGAPQKKFAWVIGLVLSSIMFVLVVLVNSYSPITGLICLICLIFLFFETAFGICLGCKFYPLFFKDKVQYCPGDVCEPKAKQDIQKTSKAQIFIVIGFIAVIILTGILFNNNFKVKPHYLFDKEQTIPNREAVERD
ncbi:MAG: DUF4395 domain-containing protein [bacterium]